MPASTQQEQGNLYPMEQPSMHKGETGKGATVAMGKHPKPGTDMSVGGDMYAKKLRKTWGKAKNAKTPFGNF